MNRHHIVQLLTTCVLVVIDNVHPQSTPQKNNNTTTYTQTCSKPPNSEVRWNITLQNTRIERTRAHLVVMQTRDFYAVDTPRAWKTLRQCTRTFLQDASFSVQCEIDPSRVRLRYKLRLIRYDDDSTGDSGVPANRFTVLVRPTDEGHFQDGLLCYPEIGLRNLRAFNVTSKSVVIGWSFYPWDIPLLRNLEIRVKRKKDNLMLLTVDTGRYTLLFFSLNSLHLNFASTPGV